MSKYQQCIDIRSNVLRNCIDLYYYENDTRKVASFKNDWYFVIERKDYDKHTAEILQFGSNKISKIKISAEWAKIYCSTYKGEVVAKCKLLGIALYESDLSNTRRFWVDHYKKDWHVAESKEYNILYFDIETDDTTKGLEIGGSRILSWATVDSSNTKHFLSLKACTGEKELLQKFVEHIKKYDIITGWNSYNFDIPYIKARMMLHKMNSYISTPHIDMMQRMIHAYRFDTKIKSYALDYIANHFVGERKIQRDTKIIDMFNNDFETFKKYNIKDVELLYRIDKQCHVFETLLKQLYWCNVFPRDIGPKAKGLYVMLDSIILQKAHQRNIHCPSPVLTHSEWSTIYDRHAEEYKQITKQLKDKKLKIKDLFDSEQSKKYTIKELQHKLPRANLKILEPYPELKNIVEHYQQDESAYFYEGGYVISPDVGLYPLVYSFDFKSLYPSIMRSFNIGFDSLCQDTAKNDDAILSSSNYKFVKSPESILHTVMKELMEKRKEYKKKLLDIIEQGKTGTAEYETVHSDEVVVKELSNSLYGITGNRTGRYFSKGAIIPRSITLTGQRMLKYAAQFAEKQTYTVIYGDSVIGSTKIKYNDKDYTFDELWKKYKHSAIKKHNKEYVDFSKVSAKPMTYSMSKHLYKRNMRNVEKKMKVSKMIRHWTTKKLYKITTESGKSVIVTKDHSMFVHRAGKDIVIKPTELNTTSDKLYVKTHRKYTLPSTAYKKGQTDWSKGLTKETDERIAIRGNSTSVAVKSFFKKNNAARQNLREHRLAQTFGKKETALEKYFETLLIQLNISYKKQKAIERYCTPDFIIESKKIAIFCDGDYWHANPKFYNTHDTIQMHNLSVDKRQNAVLKNKDWRVLRFFEYDIYNNIQDIINQLKKI